MIVTAISTLSMANGVAVEDYFFDQPTQLLAYELARGKIFHE